MKGVKGKNWHNCNSLKIKYLKDKNVAAPRCNGILLGHKKREILPFETAWMDLEGIMLSEISQEKYKYHIIPLICGI